MRDKKFTFKIMALFLFLNISLASAFSSIYATGNEGSSSETDYCTVTYDITGQGDITVYNQDGTVDFFDEDSSEIQIDYPIGTELTVEATVRDADYKISKFQITAGQNNPVDEDILSDYVHETTLTVTDSIVVNVEFISKNDSLDEDESESEIIEETQDQVIDEDTLYDLNFIVAGKGNLSLKDTNGNEYVFSEDSYEEISDLTYASGSKLSVKAESFDENNLIYGIFYVSEDGKISELEKQGSGYAREWDLNVSKDLTIYVIFTGKKDPEPILFNIIGGNPADAVQPLASGDIGQNWGMYQLFKDYTLITELGSHVNFGYSHIIQVDLNHDYKYEDITYTAYCIEYGRECPSGGYLTETALSPSQMDYIGYALAYGWRQTGEVYDPVQYNNTKAQCEYLVTQGIIWCCTKNIFNTTTGESAMTKAINGSMDPTYARTYYESLKSTILNLDKKPSFDGNTITLEWNASKNRYEATVTDSNGMLGYYNYSYSGINFAKSGNTLTIYTTNQYTNGVNASATRVVYGGKDSVLTWNAWNGKQDMASYIPFSRDVKSTITIKTKESTGNLTLNKTSSNTTITNNNSNYSLSGAKYGVYSNSSCTTSVGTMTTNVNGTATLNGLTAGTYYVKEISASKGYQLDSTVYTVTIKSGSTATLNVKETPITGKITIKKQSSDTSLVANNTNYSDLTAKFSVYNESGVRVGTITTDSSGTGNLTGLALGNYTVKETSAPNGYILNSESQSFSITTSKTSLTVTVVNDPKLGKIILKKASGYPEITNNNDCYSLQNAVYVIKNSSGTVVGRITTNASGEGSLDKLPKDTYTIQEETAPKGYEIDTYAYNLVLGYGSTQTLNVVDDPKTDPFIITVTKVNAVTGLSDNEGLAGAEFEIKYYDIQMDTDPALSGYNAVKTWLMKTNDHGEVHMTAAYKVSGDDFYVKDGFVSIPDGTVTIKETKAPLGYLVNDTVHVKKIQSGVVSEGTLETFKAPVIKEMPHYIKLSITKTIHAEDINFANGNPMFTFKVTGTDVKGDTRTCYRIVEFTEAYVNSNTDSNGNVSLTVAFDDLIAGNYIASELETSRYSLETITNIKNGTLNGDTVVFNLTTTTVTEGSATFVNDNYEQQNYSDSAKVINELKK